MYTCGKCGDRLDSCVSSILLGSFCTDISFAKYCDPATKAIKPDFQKKYRKKQKKAKKNERHFDCVVRVPELPRGHPLADYAGCLVHFFQEGHYMQRAVIGDEKGRATYRGINPDGLIRSLVHEWVALRPCKIG